MEFSETGGFPDKKAPDPDVLQAPPAPDDTMKPDPDVLYREMAQAGLQAARSYADVDRIIHEALTPETEKCGMKTWRVTMTTGEPLAEEFTTWPEAETRDDAIMLAGVRLAQHPYITKALLAHSQLWTVKSAEVQEDK